MAKIISIDEHFQHFLTGLKESFWGDLEAKTKLAWKRFLEQESERMRGLYAGCGAYQRAQRAAAGYRNGYYERDFVTRFGTIRLRIARTRGKSFLPAGLDKFQRRAPEVAMLIREAFLRGISTRQVGRVVATLTGETVSAQTVSNLTRDLDRAVEQFHQARLNDEWAYLFLDGVNLKVRQPPGRQCVQCWWPTAYVGTAPGNCSAFCAPKARARPTGRRCSTISTAAA
ncbi:MAG: transposase [Terracidiphilus sp.]